MLFTLDDDAESMEWESLDVGIVSVLEALDHARGALRDVVIPFDRVLAWSCFLPFSFSIYFLYSDHCFPTVPYTSQPGEVSVPSSIEGDLGPPHRGGTATWGGDHLDCCRPVEGGRVNSPHRGSRQPSVMGGRGPSGS